MVFLAIPQHPFKTPLQYFFSPINMGYYIETEREVGRLLAFPFSILQPINCLHSAVSKVARLIRLASFDNFVYTTSHHTKSIHQMFRSRSSSHHEYGRRMREGAIGRPKTFSTMLHILASPATCDP
jgi:hypothetical protein